MYRYLKGTCEKTDGSCPLSHKISKEKVQLDIIRANGMDIANLCRCQCVHFSCGVFVSERTALTSMSVLGKMLTYAQTLSRDTVQRESRYGISATFKYSYKILKLYLTQ